MRKYASPKDRQPEVRTKVPEAVYDILEAEAERKGRRRNALYRSGGR